MIGRRHVIPVEAFSRQRAQKEPQVAVPEVGKRWGKPATWEGSASNPDRSDEGGSSLEVIAWPTQYRHSRKVHDFSPVFREYDVVNVWQRGGGGKPIEVQNTRALLIPLGEVSEQRVIGMAGVTPIYETVRVARFLRLEFNLPIEDSEFVRAETEGEWPNLPFDWSTDG